MLWYHIEKFAGPVVVAVPSAGPVYFGVPSDSSVAATTLASGWEPPAVGSPKSAVRATPLEEKDLIAA